MAAVGESTRTLRAKNRRLAETAVGILNAEHPMTVRQAYYRLVSCGALKPLHSEYRRLSGVLSKLREEGSVPFEWLVDNTRQTLKPSSWTGIEGYLRTVRDSYRKHFWAELPTVCEIFVEKDALAASIQPVTRAFDVALRVCRGYCSLSYAAAIGSEWSKCQKPVFAYYLGDFDPSGFDIERDVRAQLERRSGRRGTDDPAEASPQTFVWQRLGIQKADFDLFGLVRLSAKGGDARTARFLAEHQHCAEVDALPPTELRKRVRDAIRSHIDPTKWAALRTVEEAERSTLQSIVDDELRHIADGFYSGDWHDDDDED